MNGIKPAREGEYAVITGASQGLGAAFAEACAQRGWNLILVALPGEGLGRYSEELRIRYSVFVLPIELDLSRPENQRRFLEFSAPEGRRIGLLVNNAGIGPNGLFDRIPEDLQWRAVDLNIQNTMALTHGLIPRLRESRGTILTVASLSAFYPMPLFAVYAASKAFLLNWSIALRHELAPLGIHVTALTPGGMYTSPEIRQKVKAQGLCGRLSTQEPARVAALALRGAAKGKAVVIPGAFNRFLHRLGALSPRNFTARAIFVRWTKSLGRIEGPTKDTLWYTRDEA